MTSFGDTRTITAVVKDADQQVIANPAVTWSSNAATIVAVTPSSGLTTTAKAMSNGSAIITATSGSVNATVGTSVLQRLSSVLVDPSSVSLAEGATRQMSVSARDGRGNTMPAVSGFEFSSNNTGVASVSSTGLITAEAAGQATITVSVTHNDVSASGTSAVTVTSSGGTPSATVMTTNSSFVPASVTIGPGGSVTWQFGAVSHNVNFDGGAITNIGTTSNASVSRTFPSVGNFTYHCNLHEGMTGTVVVN